MAFYLVSMEAADGQGGTVVHNVLVEADAPATAVGIASPGGYASRFSLIELRNYAPAAANAPAGTIGTFDYQK